MDANKKAALTGAIVTAVLTAVMFLLPFLIPLESIKMAVFELTGVWMFGNPFSQLRLFGGVPGGIVAGYLARDDLGSSEWESAMRVGVYATMVGLVFIWTAYVLYNLFSATVMDGMFPPPIFVILAVPTIFSIPLIPTYVFEGLLFGIFGRIARKARGTAQSD